MSAPGSYDTGSRRPRRGRRARRFRALVAISPSFPRGGVGPYRDRRPAPFGRVDRRRLSYGRGSISHSGDGPARPGARLARGQRAITSSTELQKPNGPRGGYCDPASWPLPPSPDTWLPASWHDMEGDASGLATADAGYYGVGRLATGSSPAVTLRTKIPAPGQSVEHVTNRSQGYLY